MFRLIGRANPGSVENLGFPLTEKETLSNLVACAPVNIFSRPTKKIIMIYRPINKIHPSHGET